MLIFGLFVILSKNPVNSAIFLILVLFFMAGLFVLLHAFFLAAVQILVYAGAVMVLFLFVIMLLNIEGETNHRLHWFGLIGAIIITPTLMWEFSKLLSSESGVVATTELSVTGTTQSVGKALFSTYLIPFEAASFLLLMAMIGVIVLCKKEPAK